MGEREDDSFFVMVNHADCRPSGTAFRHLTCVNNAYGLRFNLPSYGENNFSKDEEKNTHSELRLNPWGIASNDSELFITDIQQASVNIYSIKEFTSSFNPKNCTPKKYSFPSVTDVTVHKETNAFFVTDHLSKKIHICNQVFTDRFPNNEIFLPYSLELSGICVTDNGNIIVSDTKACNITICESHGKLLHTFGNKNKFNYPHFLCWSSKSERIFVTDACSSIVQVFDIYGQHDFSFGSHVLNNGCFINPSGIDVDESGRIFVADESLNKVQVFDRNGKLIDNFGESGFKCGNFYSPKGLTAHSGKVYIADSLNYRVQVFEEQ